jgi:ADP-ribose pyrophosphatase
MAERLTESTEHALHPWHEQLPNLPEGKGDFYYWGPNRTVDPIVITNEPSPRVLLIQRGDNGKWALPGGFIDPGEQVIAAGRRELLEETGLAIDTTEPTVVYDGPVHDHRATLHAWPETTALLWVIEAAERVTAGDDARCAQWTALDALPETLHGSHNELIQLAIAKRALLQRLGH